MGEIWVDQPIAFAAFLRLCLHGISEQNNLIHTPLHHFFRYHLGMLEQEDHRLNYIFSITHGFPRNNSISACRTGSHK